MTKCDVRLNRLYTTQSFKESVTEIMDKIDAKFPDPHERVVAWKAREGSDCTVWQRYAVDGRFLTMQGYEIFVPHKERKLVNF